MTLSQADIKTAIEAGIIMNLDNEHEAEMVDELLKNQCKDFQPNIIGMRYSSSFLRIPQKFNKIINMRFKTMFNRGLLDLDGRNSQKYLHQTQANF